MIFAAGLLRDRRRRARSSRRASPSSSRAATTRLLGPNTNLNAFEEFRRTCPARRSRSSPRAGTRAARSSRARSSASALSHWAPTGNEVDLEFADFARYFADQPEVGVVACYIEGFKDGRTLMLAADHAAQLHKPIVMVKVGRTDEGTSMAKAHTGHLTGSDAVVSAVFRQFGVTRVDGLDELLDTSMAFARTKPPTGSGPGDRRVRLRDLGRHGRAHGRHGRGRGPAPARR